MLTIVQRGGGMRGKPPETVREMSSRLPWAWDSLCFAVPFHESGSEAGILDIVNNVAPTVQSGVNWTTDNSGDAAVNLGTSSYLEYPDHPQHDRPSTALTAYARLRRSGTPDTYGGIFENTYSVAYPYSTWIIQQNAGNVGAIGGVIAVGGQIYIYDDPAAPNVVSTTEHVSVFLRWRSGESPQVSIFGERGNTIGSYTGTTAVAGSLDYAAGQSIRINASEQTGDNYDGIYSQCLLWSRKLTDAEMVALVADPYGWYSPRRSTVLTSSPYILPFGGGEMRGVTGGGGLY